MFKVNYETCKDMGKNYIKFEKMDYYYKSTVLAVTAESRF